MTRRPATRRQLPRPVRIARGPCPRRPIPGRWRRPAVHQVKSAHCSGPWRCTASVRPRASVTRPGASPHQRGPGRQSGPVARPSLAPAIHRHGSWPDPIRPGLRHRRGPMRRRRHRAMQPCRWRPAPALGRPAWPEAPCVHAFMRPRHAASRQTGTFRPPSRPHVQHRMASPAASTSGLRQPRRQDAARWRTAPKAPLQRDDARTHRGGGAGAVGADPLQDP